jgi:hypothetical protein
MTTSAALPLTNTVDLMRNRREYLLARSCAEAQCVLGIDHDYGG